MRGESPGPFGTRVERRARGRPAAMRVSSSTCSGEISKSVAAGPAVEPLGVPANLLDATTLDGRQHLRDGRDDLRVRLGGHILTVRLPGDREGAADPRLVLRVQVHTYNIGRARRPWQPGGWTGISGRELVNDRDVCPSTGSGGAARGSPYSCPELVEGPFMLPFDKLRARFRARAATSSALRIGSRGRVLPRTARRRAQCAGRLNGLGTFLSMSASHTSALPSDGARQSPRGLNDPPCETFGPFGIADRLNCAKPKKRRTKTISHWRIAGRS